MFSYLGLTFFAYRNFTWSPELIGVEFCIVLIGRCLGTFFLIGLLKCFKYDKNHPNPINFKELFFIWYAGLIRGAIAFGLVLRIDHGFSNREVIITTCLSLVVFTTVFFGSTVGLLSKCFFSKKKTNSAQAALLEEANDSASYALSVSSEALSLSSKSSHRETLVHYNEMTHDEHTEMNFEKKKSRKSNSCAVYLKRFDELIMRPIFIYRYEKQMQDKAREFYDIFMHEGTALEKIFAKNNEQAADDRSARSPNSRVSAKTGDGSHQMLESFKKMRTRRMSIGFKPVTEEEDD